MPERSCLGIARVLCLLSQTQCIFVCILPVAKHQFVRFSAYFDVVHHCECRVIFWRHDEGLVVADCSRLRPPKLRALDRRWRCFNAVVSDGLVTQLQFERDANQRGISEPVLAAKGITHKLIT